jgi:hypothetical protein
VEYVLDDLKIVEKGNPKWSHPQALTSADPVPLGGPSIWPKS